MWVRDRGKCLTSSQSFRHLLILLCLVNSVASDTGSRRWENPGMKTAYACQDQRLVLQCPRDLVIKVIRANYGRFSVAICNEGGNTDWSVNCMSPRSLRIVQDRCNNERECEISAVSDDFGGDPCPSTSKYLEVYYGCYAETTTTTSTTSNPLPPWLTTKSSLSLYPGLIDLDITAPPPAGDISRRVPITIAAAPLDSTQPATASPDEEDEAVTTSNAVVVAGQEDTTTTTSTTTTDASYDVAPSQGGKKSEDEAVTITAAASVPSQSSRRRLGLKSAETTTLRTKAVPLSVADDDADEDIDKLVYTSEENNNDTVRIVLSSLATEAPPPPIASNDEAMQAAAAAPVSVKCPPRGVRTISWQWTPAGTEAEVACPVGTRGMARWTCTLAANSGNNKGPVTAVWEPSGTPDLSGCQSTWMGRILTDLRKSDAVGTIAADLVQYVAANPLYGGDISGAVSAMTIIGEKLEYQLAAIPTMEQREAMVVEVAQSLVRTASSLLDVDSLAAWTDLPVGRRGRVLASFMAALERAGHLLPRAIVADREVSISSQNVLLSVKKISFRNIRGTEFPSPAARATRDWQQYADTVEIPALVLMENMAPEAANVLFITANNLDILMTPEKRWSTGSLPISEVVNSQVMHVSLGEGGRASRVQEPLTALFRHIATDNSNISSRPPPRCAHWDDAVAAWSEEHCRRVDSRSNATHTECKCNVLGSSLGLLEQVDGDDSAAAGAASGLSHVTTLVVIITTVTVSLVAVFSIFLLIVYCHRVKVRDDWKFGLAGARLPCLEKSRRPSLNKYNTANYYGSSPTFINTTSTTIIPNNDFMILSQAALAAHDCYEPSQPGPQTAYRGATAARSSYGCHSNAANEGSQYSSQQHIYMEVDPLYCRQLPHSSTQVELLLSSPGEEEEEDTPPCCSTPGLAGSSSNSSQSSSGYSTAPSDTYCYADHLNVSAAQQQQQLFLNKGSSNSSRLVLHQGHPHHQHQLGSGLVLRPTAYTPSLQHVPHRHNGGGGQAGGAGGFVFSISEGCDLRNAGGSMRKVRGGRKSLAAAVNGGGGGSMRLGGTLLPSEHQLLRLDENHAI